MKISYEYYKWVMTVGNACISRDDRVTLFSSSHKLKRMIRIHELLGVSSLGGSGATTIKIKEGIY